MADTILVSVDLGDHSNDVIEVALREATAFDAELLVVHCVHDLADQYGIYIGGGPIDTLQQDIETTARDKLDALFDDRVKPRLPNASKQLLFGQPWSEIVGCAMHHRAERIVIGAHVAAKPEHRILGSTAERVLRNAPCPIIIVPPQPE